MSKAPNYAVTAEMLAKLSPEAIAAWAGRCALRVQPLVKVDSFGMIPKEQVCSHIEALDIAVTLAMIPISDVNVARNSYAAADIAARAAHANSTTRAASNAAASAARAAHAATDVAFYTTGDFTGDTVAAEATARIVNVATRAADAAGDAIHEFGDAETVAFAAAEADYKYLVKSKSNIELFYTQQLWANGEPQDWRVIVNKWGSDLNSLVSQFPEEVQGLYGIYERHTSMLEGRGINIEEALARINIWIKRGGPSEDYKQDSEEHDKHSLSSDDKTEQSDDPAEQAIEKPVIERQGAPHSIPDGPTTYDCLDRKPLVQSLAAMFAAEEQATPFTLALLGDWGAGKSSVMDQLKEKLESVKSNDRAFEFLFAKFNAWEYEHTDNIRAGLAQEVMKGIIDDLGSWDTFVLKVQFAAKEHSWDFFKALLGVVAAVAVLGGLFWLGMSQSLFSKLDWGGEIVTTGLLGATGAFIIHLWKTYKPLFNHPIATKLHTYLKLPEYGEQIGIVPVMKHHIETICQLQGVTKHNPMRRLVGFIDDLDRCGHKCIMQTFDAVRLVMDIPNVIVVIAIDYRIAFAAVANHYADLADDARKKEDIARDYLGKIIQLPVQLSKPTNMRQFIRERLFATADKDKTEQLSRDKRWQSLGEKLDSLDIKSDESEMESTVDDEKSPVGASMLSEQIDGNEVISEANSDLVPELMPESPEDCRRFEFWTGNFEFKNPRQLIRLRNAYRLLTQLDHDSYPETSDDQRMAMLFWLEFLHQKKGDEQKQYEDLLIKPENGKRDVIQPYDRDRISKDIALCGIHPIIGNGFDKKIENQRLKYKSLKERVSRFVLPAIRTQTSKVIDNLLEGEATHAADEIEE